MSSKNPKTPAKATNKMWPRYTLVFIFSCAVSILVYAVLQYYTSPPPMPIPNPDEYWGTSTTDSNTDESIRPFRIEFSDVMLNDLKDRLLHYRKPPHPLENVGFAYGFNSNFLTQVVDYWRNKYNFKDRENYFNQYKHFKTNIQGLDIHFMHVKPNNVEDVEVVPILLLHGWPGSFREFYDMIPLLTRPQDGRDFVFEVIVPSLPGFGYSQAAVKPGLGPMEMAVIMNNLMQRLGFQKYYIQGGDLGHSVGSILATLYPNTVLGFHTNLPILAFNPITHFWITVGSLWPSLIEKVPELQARLYPLSERHALTLEETGYMHLQGTKPDTVGAALTDSPAGLAAYILEKFSTWTNPGFRVAYDGNLLKKFSLTHLLDNVMVYWDSGSITTSMRVYAETLKKDSNSLVFDRIPTTVPTWGIKFKHELAYCPDVLLKTKYSNYLQSTVVEEGGHFAAIENPQILAQDVYTAVYSFRQFYEQLQPSTKKTVYDFTANDINGNEIKLDKYKGYVLIIVNVASECGFTDTNYRELNLLHEKYYNRGLRILAFPCNQFNGQEPGTPKDILTFTKQRGVQFDIYEKVDVNGDNAHPLWKYLKAAKGGTMGDYIKWNFSKFVVNRNGVPVARLGPNVNPLDLEPYFLQLL